MLIGCIADDFTGASDVANTLNQQGMKVTQFVGTPSGDSRTDCQAAVVALKSRTCPRDEAIEQSLRALRWLKQQGCQQFLFKYCSTFDSTKDGNIGPVAAALLEELGADGAFVCPSFPKNGRTVFKGHLFVFDKLLNESGMENHPLTPMVDADIRRWLAYQTQIGVGAVAHEVVRKGHEEIARAFSESVSQGRPLVVVDALDDTDLMEIGRAAAKHKLITGGSAVALGLPDNFRKEGLLEGNATSYPGPTVGAAVVLSGSCSVSSRGQVDQFLREHPGFKVDPRALMTGSASVAELLVSVLAVIDQTPIVYSTADRDEVSAVQNEFGVEKLALALDEFFGGLASALVEKGVARVVVGGGETSGAVVQALGASALHVGPEIAPGVPALAMDDTHVRLALKSGNFGGPNFYQEAVLALGGNNNGS